MVSEKDEHFEKERRTHVVYKISIKSCNLGALDFGS